MDILFLCIKIFFIRILDVSMGTTRTIITVKGKAFLASLIGFIEVFIWFMVVREALSTDVGGIWIAISYSLGFATGTYIGGKIAARFIKGNLGVQVITNDEQLDEKLREHGYAVTVLNVEGKDVTKKKYMLLIEISNNKLEILKDLIKETDSSAFLTVSETKHVQNGYFIK